MTTRYRSLRIDPVLSAVDRRLMNTGREIVNLDHLPGRPIDKEPLNHHGRVAARVARTGYYLYPKDNE